MKKLVVVDVARGIAVLMVLVYHLGLLLPPRALPAPWDFVWYKIWVNGTYGVSLFFVLSGFLITRLIAESSGGLFEPDFREFYTRRAGRILPLLIFICGLGLAFVFFVSRAEPLLPITAFFGSPAQLAQPVFWISIAAFWFNWFRMFTHDSIGFHWGVLWSLSVEEQFYLFYPLLLKKLGSTLPLTVCLLIFTALGPLSQWIGYAVGLNHQVVHYNSFNGFGLIALGGLLHLACERWKSALADRPGATWLLAAVGAALVLKIYFHQPYFADYWGNRLDYFGIGLGLFLFLLGALHLRFFEGGPWPWLGWPGRMSYGVYLYQCSVICVLFPFLTGLNAFASFLTAALAVWAVAALSFYLYERPANLFIRKRFGGSK